jgi:hypothetical protein
MTIHQPVVVIPVDGQHLPGPRGRTFGVGLLLDEEEGLTTEPGRHSPESSGTGRNSHAYVSLGYAAFVQLADVVQGARMTPQRSL